MAKRRTEIPWKVVGGGALLAAVGYALTRDNASAGAGAGAADDSPGGCPDWSGDSAANKAMQRAIATATKAHGGPSIGTVDGRPGAMTCRGAEWLVANKHATPDIQRFAVSSACGCGRKRAPCGITGPVASDKVKTAVLNAIEAKGYSRAEGDKAIRQESNWHPSAVACMGADKHPVAGGLMQFITVALKSIGLTGWSPDQFAALSGEEQLPYLLKFIAKMPTSKLHRNGDFHLALFVPAYVNKPLDFVVYEVGSEGWTQNPGLRAAGGGPITVASVLAKSAA